MAVWKKVIVSGSVAELSVVSASAFYIQNGQLITTSPSSTVLSGSFSGSFSGNGSGLTNVALDSAITNGTGVSAFSYNGTGSATSWDAMETNRGSGVNTGIITNITSLKFLASAGTQNWKVWVFKAATS